jgi:hypothetical protein
MVIIVVMAMLTSPWQCLTRYCNHGNEVHFHFVSLGNPEFEQDIWYDLE